MKNKKGLSQVVTTLIIILLVLVAIGIIWGVVSNLLDKSKGTIESSAKCMDLDVKATKVVDNSDGSFDVTLTRTANGEDISGVKVVIYSNNSLNTEVIDVAYAIAQLETSIQQANSTTYENGFPAGSKVAKIDVTPYFTDDSGVDQLCSVTASKEF